VKILNPGLCPGFFVWEKIETSPLISARLWDSGDLLNEIFKYYEKFDDKLKAELPLKRIWGLVLEEAD
jgi:restriction system protein